MKTDAEKVIDVHRKTGWPVLICQEVLAQTGGDVDSAVRVLSEQYKTYISEEQKAQLEESGSWVDELTKDA